MHDTAEGVVEAISGEQLAAVEEVLRSAMETVAQAEDYVSDAQSPPQSPARLTRTTSSETRAMNVVGSATAPHAGFVTSRQMS